MGRFISVLLKNLSFNEILIKRKKKNLKMKIENIYSVNFQYSNNVCEEIKKKCVLARPGHKYRYSCFFHKVPN